MAQSIVLPKMFDSMTHGVVAKWHKVIGDAVKEGEILAEIETDKATMELASSEAGTILYCVEPGEFMVGRLMCIIGEKEEDITDLLDSADRQNEFLVHQARSIRTFIGAKDYELSQEFYKDLGFHGIEVTTDMTYFSLGQFGFYLQKYYVKNWINNSMVFLEVEDAMATYKHLQLLKLPEKYAGVRLSHVKEDTWGRECFLHDPSGVLWHFGEFY